jgi:hypothetical protein
MKALQKMGYREMKEGLWGKPIGHSILIYRIKEKTLYHQTVGITDRPITWDSQNIDYEVENFLELIQNTEAEFAMGSGMSYHQPHDLSFLTQREVIETLLQ